MKQVHHWERSSAERKVIMGQKQKKMIQKIGESFNRSKYKTNIDFVFVLMSRWSNPSPEKGQDLSNLSWRQLWQYLFFVIFTMSLYEASWRNVFKGVDLVDRDDKFGHFRDLCLQILPSCDVLVPKRFQRIVRCYLWFIQPWEPQLKSTFKRAAAAAGGVGCRPHRVKRARRAQICSKLQNSSMLLMAEHSGRVLQLFYPTS